MFEPLPPTDPAGLAALLAALRQGRGFAHKQDIAAVMARLQPQLPLPPLPLPLPLGTEAGPGAWQANGDDCAVLPAPGGPGHLLLAIEGLMPDFVAADPWFAGYSAVLVNLSDVAAMGGRPLAVVDALWSADEPHAAQLLAGMQAASAAYGVPLVGGHTNLRSPSPQLAVAVLGHVRALISGFAARPGDRLLVAVDLRGRWHGEAPFWNASTGAPPARLQADLALLPTLAEAGLCHAGKDISMAGVLGTALMLLEGSRCGAELDLARLPTPGPEAGWPGWQAPGAAAHAARLRWLSAFPSFGHVLAVAPAQVAAVQAHFAAQGIACAEVGVCTPGTRLAVRLGKGPAQTLWDLAEQGFVHPVQGGRP